MARYTRTPVSTLQGINNELAKVELAMEDTLDRKGVTPNFMDSNLDMNSRRILNLPAPLTDQEPLRKGDLPTGLSVSSQYVDDKFLPTPTFLKAQGLSGNYGFFEKGFTYNEAGDVGIDSDGNIWTYNGALPFNVEKGTVPSVPAYTQYLISKNYTRSFDSIDAVKAYSNLSKLIGQRITTGEYHAGTGYGGATYEVVSAGSVTPNDIDIIQGVADVSACIVLRDRTSASNFGVIGASSEADTALRINYFIESGDQGGYFEFDEYHYTVDDTINFTGLINADIKFNGDVRFVSTNFDKPVVNISGRILNITGIVEIGYDSSVDITDYVYDRESNKGVGVLYTGLARSKVDGWRVRHVAIGEKIDRETGYGYPNGQNALFSVSFVLKDIADVSYAFFDYRAYNGGNTGNYIANMYMTNNINDVIQECNRFGWIGTTSEFSFGQLNFERAKCRHLMTVSSDVDAIHADAIHIEGVIPTVDGEGFFYFNNNTNFSFGVMTIVKPYIDFNLTPNYSLFRVGDNVTVTGMVKERDTETSNGTPNLRVVQYAGTGIESTVKLSASKLDVFQNLEFGVPLGMQQVLTVDKVYPKELPTYLNDSSLSWLSFRDSKEIIFTGLTTSRSLIINNEFREYEGMYVDVVNTSDTYNVNVSLNTGAFTYVVAPNTRQRISYSGSEYLALP